MWAVFLLLLLLLPLPLSVHAEYLGELSANPSPPDSTANPFGGGEPSVRALAEQGNANVQLLLAQEILTARLSHNRAVPRARHLLASDTRTTQKKRPAG